MEKKMENEMESGLGFRGLGFRGLELCGGYMGIMEKKMETTIAYWGNLGIMDRKMEATIMGLYDLADI